MDSRFSGSIFLLISETIFFALGSVRHMTITYLVSTNSGFDISDAISLRIYFTLILVLKNELILLEISTFPIDLCKLGWSLLEYDKWVIIGEVFSMQLISLSISQKLVHMNLWPWNNIWWGESFAEYFLLYLESGSMDPTYQKCGD